MERKQTQRGKRDVRVVAMVDETTRAQLEAQRDKIERTTGVRPSLSAVAAQHLTRAASK